MTSTFTDPAPRWTLEHLPMTRRAPSAAALIREGLSRPQKALPPLLLYDARGSALFEQICDLPEYYVTRTERALLARAAPEIAGRLSPEVTLGELGSGSSEKTALVIDALLAERRALRYLPVDISEAALREAAERLTRARPRLEVHGIVAEYRDGARRLAELYGGQHLTLFLGSNLGNFEQNEAQSFLRDIRRVMGPRDLLLLGVDMVKDRDVLERAYDDAQGVTAAFDLNLLAHLNARYGANFDLDAFRHRAVWVEDLRRIEMHLVSEKAQRVRIEAVDASFDFAAGEHIHTESSHKYTPESLDALTRAAGWSRVDRFVDDRGYFSLDVLAPAPDAEAN